MAVSKETFARVERFMLAYREVLREAPHRSELFIAGMLGGLSPFVTDDQWAKALHACLTAGLLAPQVAEDIERTVQGAVFK